MDFYNFDTFNYDTQTFGGATSYGPNIFTSDYEIEEGEEDSDIPLPTPMRNSPPMTTS